MKLYLEGQCYTLRDVELEIAPCSFNNHEMHLEATAISVRVTEGIDHLDTFKGCYTLKSPDVSCLDRYREGDRVKVIAFVTETTHHHINLIDAGVKSVAIRKFRTAWSFTYLMLDGSHRWADGIVEAEWIDVLELTEKQAIGAMTVFNKKYKKEKDDVNSEPKIERLQNYGVKEVGLVAGKYPAVMLEGGKALSDGYEGGYKKVHFRDMNEDQQEAVARLIRAYAQKETLIIKYREGAAYYTVCLDDWARTGNRGGLRMYHMLNLKRYDTVKNKMKVVAWDFVPESYQLDALALNPKIKAKYGNKQTRNITMNQEATNSMFDFGRFGAVTTDEVVFSPKGLAIKMTKNNRTKYRAWDKDKNVMMDVTGLTMPLNGMAFIMPAKKLEVGDIIQHDEEFVFVAAINEDKTFRLLGPSGELAEHIECKSYMGFNFYRKLVTPYKRFKGDDAMMGMMKMNMMQGMMGGDNGGGFNPMAMMMLNGKGDMFGDMFDFDGLFGSMESDTKEDDKPAEKE